MISGVYLQSEHTLKDVPIVPINLTHEPPLRQQLLKILLRLHP